VTDSGTDRLVCLSGDGKLLLAYGGHASLDDRSGAGFCRPSGLAIVATGGQEYLYVGDSGNLRIVKFRLG
jgi:hypothetical protein